MKELSIEEKAKRYDEALEKAKDYHKQLLDEDNPEWASEIEKIFPELKESEDERIRKKLIELFHDTVSNDEIFSDYGLDKTEVLDWLEKQGEKHIDKELSKLLNHVICMFINNPLIPYFERDEVSKKIIPYVERLEKQGEQKHIAEEVLIKAGLKPYKDGDQWCVLLGDNIQEGICGFGDTIEDALYAFLKDLIASQNKQKPADKVEPKFHEGDWVIDNKNRIGVVTRILREHYIISFDGREEQVPFVRQSLIKPWTIQDAKDGDVLVNWNNTVFIFDKIEDDVVKYIIAYNNEWNDIKCPTNQLSHLGLVEPQFEFHPATKEQRDTLMKAMADAGYTFYFEKKELRKIEQKTSEWKQENNKFLTEFENAMLHVGESFFGKNHGLDPNNTGDVKEQAALLMELANNYSGWTKEDDKFLKDISLIVNEYYSQYFNGITNVDRINWLKSIKQRYTWKPSDEQMDALRYVTNFDYGGYKAILVSLYEQLKKLREE